MRFTSPFSKLFGILAVVVLLAQSLEIYAALNDVAYRNSATPRFIVDRVPIIVRGLLEPIYLFGTAVMIELLHRLVRAVLRLTSALEGGEERLEGDTE